MKKTLTVLTALACFCSIMPSFAMPASALEACTETEFSEQMKLEAENAFPDPDAPCSDYTEGDLTFHLYEEYAVLYECKNREITEAVIPAYVNELPVRGADGSPFGFCRKLTSVSLPETVQYINWGELTETTVVRVGSEEQKNPPKQSLKNITVAEDNPYFTVSDGILYSKDLKTLIGCPSAMEITELTIPAQTEIIGDYAFIDCQYLEKAVIPENVTHICNGAFAGCPKLKYAEFPAGITAVCGLMFAGCKSLETVKLNGAVTKIGYEAFRRCTALKDFTIPETVTVIGSAAFEETACMENVNGIHYVQNWVVGSDEDAETAILREGTVGAAEMSFFDRHQITYLDFPQSVKSVGNLCFYSGSTGKASVLVYHSSRIGERTFPAAKTTTDIYIFDPECEIADGEKTIPALYTYAEPERFSADDHFSPPEVIKGDVTIHGYAGSTAQAYAEQYGRKFAEIPAEALQGDVNCDGEVSIADTVLLQKWLLSQPDARIIDPKAADMDQDGILNAHDLTLLKARIAAASPAE